MRALVLSGGGVKGAYQVGVLCKWLYEDHRSYDIMCGVSVGALNTSFLSQYKKGNEREAYNALLALWNTIDDSKIYKKWFLIRELAGIFKPSLYNSQPLMDLVRAYLDTDKIKNSGIKLRIGAVSLESGKYFLFDENHPKIVEGVIASSAFPTFLTPIEIDGEIWTDGGVRTVTPIAAAIKAGATHIDVVMTSPADSTIGFKKKPNAIDITMRVIDLMSDEIIANDIKLASMVNRAIRKGANLPDKKIITFNIIRPKNVLIKNSLDFNPEGIKRMMEIGYNDSGAFH